MGEVRDYTRNVMPLQVRDGVFSIGEEAEARASKIKSREATAKVWTREEQLSARSIFEVADVHVAPHLYELYFRDDLMGDGRFGKGDGSVMLLHPGCSSNNNVRPLNRYSCFKTYSEKTGATAQRPFHKRHQQNNSNRHLIGPRSFCASFALTRTLRTTTT